MISRIFILFCLLLGIGTASAQEAINVIKINDKVISTKLKDVDKITISNDLAHITIHKTQGETTIPIGDIRKIVFGDYKSASVEETQSIRFHIYTAENITIDSEVEMKSIAVYNLAGAPLFSTILSDMPHTYVLSTTLFNKGTYIIRVETTVNTISQKIFIK